MFVFSFLKTRGAAVCSALVAVGIALLTGCATAPTPVPLTGNILVDGPNAIANGPARDRVLWEYRTAAASIRQGQFDQAKRHLDDCIATLQGLFGPDAEARKARGYFHSEAKKTFVGEPYERSMAFIYRGLLYWRDGERDNARACFRSAEVEDSIAEAAEFRGDWVLPDYLDGFATLKLGGDGSDAYKRAVANAKGVTLPPYNSRANTLLFLEFGPGPTKYATGQYAQELRFQTRESDIRSARFKVGSIEIPVAPTDDVAYQATTRGGRVMDHILGNKAVFKSTTDTIGNVALIGGLSTAAFSHDQTAQQVGMGIALAGVLSKAISAATTPTADTRAWDNLPRYLSFAALELPPGPHALTVEFLDAAGRPRSNLTKSINFRVEEGRDSVLIVSDTSTSPQNQ